MIRARSAPAPSPLERPTRTAILLAVLAAVILLFSRQPPRRPTRQQRPR